MGGSGCLNSDEVTQVVLAHAKTQKRKKCRVLNKSPAQLSQGRVFKDFPPRNVSDLMPKPDNLMSGEVKGGLQGKVRANMGNRWSEHTKFLPELPMGDIVQMQNLVGRYPLK